MTPSNTISFLLLLLLFLVTLSGKAQSQNTSFAINAFTPHSLRLIYERDAYVPPDETYVRLAPSLQGGTNSNVRSVGRVLYTTPVKIWDQFGLPAQASFETTINFQITPSRSNGSAYGMTFFVIPVNSTTNVGGEGDNLGIYNALVPGSLFFTVELDFIIGTSYDPPYAHLGININSIRSQNHTRVPNVFSVKERVTLRITYDAPTRLITAVADFDSSSTTATVSFVFNLKALLPQEVQVGLSASTGQTFQIPFYDFYSWHFNSTVVRDLNLAVDSEETLLSKTE